MLKGSDIIKIISNYLQNDVEEGRRFLYGQSSSFDRITLWPIDVIERKQSFNIGNALSNSSPSISLKNIIRNTGLAFLKKIC